MKKTSVTLNGQPRIRVDFGIRQDGPRKRRVIRHFRTQAAADAAIFADRKASETVGKKWVDLPAQERAGVVEVLAEMKSAGHTLRAVWQAFRSERMAAPDAPKVPTLAQCIDELIETKRRGNKRESYLRRLDHYLGMFAKGRENLPVNRIEVLDVEQWFDGRQEALSTRASNLMCISSLLGHAMRRGYRSDNPCDRMDRLTVEQKAPLIFSVYQSARILIHVAKCDPDFLVWVSLALLAGCRPEECDKIPRELVDLEKGTIRIDSSMTKVRTARIVHLTPAAIGWLKLAVSLKSRWELPHGTRRRHQRRLREWMNLSAWPTDILRHTAASHLIAYHESFSKVGLELGNSETVLRRHYRELVSREDGVRFFEMVPTRRLVDRLT